MDLIAGKLVVSPSDLVGHLACGHLTTLDREVLDGLRVRPDAVDEELEILRKRGFEHEADHLTSLQAQGLTVAEIPDPVGADRLEALRERAAETEAAMRDGVDVIFQATFLDETGDIAWRGHADFLTKVPRPSALGAHSYEPEDTKLARHVKPGAVLQLCHYAEQVERIQGVAPESIHVVLGTRDRETVRLADVAAYYRAAKARFLAALAEAPVRYPLPTSHCDVCRWIDECEARREADDHLCRVAGLGRHQVRRLEEAGVSTMAALAALPEGTEVPGIGAPTLARLRQQARLQSSGLVGAEMPVEPLLPLEEARGLLALPPPHPGDLFYDIEGDPFVGPLGLEYLHGFGWLEAGELQFKPFWAHTPDEERQAFEALIDFILERHRRHPGMHVYHFAPYETTALGKLMGRYGTRERELDHLLRHNVFVDLYRVVRQGLVIGTSSYGLKKLEPLYMGARTADITDGGSSIVEYERWLDTGDHEILDRIEAYNRDDVESTWRLRDWLLGHQAHLLAEVQHGRISVERSVERAAEEAMAAAEASIPDRDDVDALAQELLAGRVTEPGPDDDEDTRVRFLMAHLLGWHAREDKPEWWRYFERVKHCDLTDLYHDSDAISGLAVEGEGELDEGGRSTTWTYRFDPDQEHKLKVGDTPVDPDAARADLLHGTRTPRPGRIVALDPLEGVVKLSRSNGSSAPHPAALIPSGPIPTTEQRRSLATVARALLAHGIDGDGPLLAARQLLARRLPRVAGVTPGQPLRRPGEPSLDAARRLVSGLQSSYLPVQGPPGSGKTYAAARAIAELLATGRRVGVTANSHAVVSRLLEEVVDAAVERGARVVAMQKTSADQITAQRDAVQTTANNGEVVAGLAADVNLVGGTPWLFAREEMAGTLDTLVVDEAGQLSLANVVSVAPSARNLVLVGDPQQLAQPSKGVHPPGVGVSALEHVLADAHTIDDAHGLFLDRSWRLHPDICAFVSEQVYDDRLESMPQCAAQAVGAGPVASGSGLRWLPVEHRGNRLSSVEEAAAIAEAFRALLGRTWTDCDGAIHPVTLQDILVVAPYNAQVNQLVQVLPQGARVGTVDKFQGQEAAIVFVSMTASTADSVPRGMEFLYSRNRINVAVSRAQALTIMVASPALLAVECRSLEQMMLANVLCRYVEMATAVELPALGGDAVSAVTTPRAASPSAASRHIATG